MTDRMPANSCPYRSWPDQPVWYVFVGELGGFQALQSSRVIVVAKADGRVLYDGSATDEG